MIETLIATALMAAILVALATVTAQWLPNWNRGFARVQRTELAAIGIERIITDLASAEFITPNGATENPLFVGNELSVTFVRTALGPNTSPGLEIVRIASTADARGPAMVRTRTPFVPLAPNANLDQLNFADLVVLVRAPYRMSFSYAGRDRVWRDSWRDLAQLPSAIRVNVRSTETGQSLAVSSATMVHVNAGVACVSGKGETACPTSSTAGPDKAGAPRPGAGKVL